MKSIAQLLKKDHKHMEHQLCHPRRQATFDHSAIEKKIEQIKARKQQLRIQAERKQMQLYQKLQRYEQNPFQQILDESLQPLSERTSIILKQKQKFIEQKVYIGTKNNVNNQYISRVIDANQAPTALKDQLNLFMEDILSNLQSDIYDGQYQIFNKKELISPKNSTELGSNGQINPTKLINIKKVQLSNKIGQLRDQLTKTELQQQKLSNSQVGSDIEKLRNNSSARASSLNNRPMHNSINIEDFNMKSQKTKKAEQFIKKIQMEQQEKRARRKKKQQELRKMQIKSVQEKEQFQHQIKSQRHEKLKRKFEQDRQNKQLERSKSLSAKQQYEKFLQQYKKRIPLYKEKQIKFKKLAQKQQKERAMSVFTQIKQAKRSIDITEIKDHQKKYQIVRKQFQSEKLANLKHRQKQIQLRHKQDRLYFRGRYHSMIKEEEERQPQDPTVKRDQLIKKKKEFAEKVKKQHVPQVNQSKQKELEELILQINRNKPNRQSKNLNELGNHYLAELHKLVKQMKAKGRVKVQLPEEIQPRYKDYLKDLKRQRQYETISYNSQSPDWLEKEALRRQRNALQKQKILRNKDEDDVKTQLKRIDQLDMELLKTVQLKASLLEKIDPQSEKGSGSDSDN